jgi:hypothetical protein
VQFAKFTLGHIKKKLLSVLFFKNWGREGGFFCLFFKVGEGREVGFFSFFPLSFVDMEKYEIKTAFSSK